jgi:hypothetical protein
MVQKDSKGQDGGAVSDFRKNEVSDTVGDMDGAKGVPKETVAASRHESTRRASVQVEKPETEGRMRSINKGSIEWKDLIKPFVSDLVFMSLVPRRYHQTKVSFRPYTCHAVVLFVDLSG